MAMEEVTINGWPSEPWMAWARLPMQAVFIAWAWFATLRAQSKQSVATSDS